MKKTFLSAKLLSVILCLVLTAAMALIMTACKDTHTVSEQNPVDNSSLQESTDPLTLGEGKTSFTLKVTDKNGNSTDFTINTDKKTVGDALLELELISGEMGDYGLYIKEVNKITADYDTDGTYWAFYINGEYASSGVDTTDIVEGQSYELKVQK